MKTDQFIDDLSRDLKPVERLANPNKRFGTWLLVAGLCIGIGVSLVGVRDDISMSLMHPSFLFESVLALLVAVLAAYAAFQLSVPSDKPPAKWLIILPLSVWVLQLTGRYLFVDEANLDPVFFWGGGKCAAEIVALGVAPGALLFIMMRKAAPTKLGWSGAMAVISVLGLAAFGAQFTCMAGDPVHLLTWHLIPVVLVGAAGVLLGRLVLKW